MLFWTLPVHTVGLVETGATESASWVHCRLYAISLSSCDHFRELNIPNLLTAEKIVLLWWLDVVPIMPIVNVSVLVLPILRRQYLPEGFVPAATLSTQTSALLACHFESSLVT